MAVTNSPQASDTYAVLVTGANSGVGFAICTRLIDEFLQRNLEHLHSKRFILIITTRDERKGNDTVDKLRNHVDKLCEKEERRFPGITQEWSQRIELRQEILDLTSIISIRALAKKMIEEKASGQGITTLDAIICNAGIGGWTSVNYLKATWCILTDWVDAVSYPSFKNAGVGWVTKPQLGPKESLGQQSTSSETKNSSQPPIGEVFCANVFGHYLLGHYLNPLLATSQRRTPARIVWMSSMEAYRSALDLADIQGIRSPAAYESSKRLTDVLALTSAMKSVSPWAESYFVPTSVAQTPSKASSRTTRSSPVQPKMYLAHPGICSTGIMPLPYILALVAEFSLHAARWLGSPWHPVVAYLGAVAPVWLAMVSATSLDALESGEGRGKWGSGTSPDGTECVRRTWVEGWGWGGKDDEAILPGRRRGTREVTEENRLQLEEEGRECWKQMEELRKEWEARLEAAGN